jgi:hypothetical protein
MKIHIFFAILIIVISAGSYIGLKSEVVTDPKKEECVQNVCCALFLKCYDKCGKTDECQKKCNDEMGACIKVKCGVPETEKDKYGCG